MHDEHEETIRELLLLQRVAQRISSILDLDRLLEEILSDVARFVTMIYAILDIAHRRLVFANAGHPYPLFVDSLAGAFSRPRPGRHDPRDRLMLVLGSLRL